MIFAFVCYERVQECDFRYRGSLFTYSRPVREAYLTFGCIFIWSCLFLDSNNDLGPGCGGVLLYYLHVL